MLTKFWHSLSFNYWYIAGFVFYVPKNCISLFTTFVVQVKTVFSTHSVYGMKAESINVSGEWKIEEKENLNSEILWVWSANLKFEFSTSF